MKNAELAAAAAIAKGYPLKPIAYGTDKKQIRWVASYGVITLHLRTLSTGPVIWTYVHPAIGTIDLKELRADVDRALELQTFLMGMM